MKYDVSLQTISWVNELRNNESLEISPKFQRRAVWQEKERAFLMTTIYSNLPFPEIYMQVETDIDSGKSKYVVVDGQQRVTSILMFIDNEFPLPDNDEWNGEYFKDLSTKDEREPFWNYKIVVRFLYETNDAEIRELFTRLNTNNISLNDQELRNARFSGAFKQLSERLADNPIFQSIGIFTARDIRRMLDIEYVSELLVRQLYGITNKKDLLEAAYIEFDEEVPSESTVEEDFIITIGLVLSIFDKAVTSRFKTKGNFHSLFGVCYEYYKKTGRRAFHNQELVKTSVLDLIDKAKKDEFDEDMPEIEEYAEVAARSTSDKSRRAKREEILSKLIFDVEQISSE